MEKKPEAPDTATATATTQKPVRRTRRTKAKEEKPLLIITEDDLYMFANGTQLGEARRPPRRAER